MSADKYPLPAYACNVWVAGDSLMVAFPGTVTEQGHTIKLPASEGGLKTALSILRNRSDAQDLRLGNAGTPTQWDVECHAGAAWGKVTKRQREEREALKLQKEAEEQAYRTARTRRAERESREAAEFLKELGL